MRSRDSLSGKEYPLFCPERTSNSARSSGTAPRRRKTATTPRTPGEPRDFHASQHGAGNLDRATEGGRYRIIEESNLDFAAINCWLGQKAAQFAQRLDAIRDGDGTVLDHSVMVYMSEMRTHDHDAYDLPIVLLGGDSVLLNDAHVAYDPLGSDRQLRDLWFTIMNQYYGLGVASFGDDLRGEPSALLEEILR
ncbi:hypothetical protein BE17_41905 [Sorangium cellulosum]|uniref:Uncharacterized protein n=1 Tax=Sorangium cellulosum TaxID=56 RepID=A0A150R9C5_SORCE|nr:hypothetical protein BE17_41905 [Sorangium cellulosum]